MNSVTTLMAPHNTNRALCDNTEGQARWDEAVFVFVDNSNIFISAQTIGTAPRDIAIRVSVPRLADFVRGGRHPREQVVAGSNPPASAIVWDRFRDENFSVQLEDRRGGGEQGVDDILHAHALRALEKDFGNGERSQTLVLVTGYVTLVLDSSVYAW
jgi:hypothetical protein